MKGHHWVDMPAPDGGPSLRLCAPDDPPDILAVDIEAGGWTYPEPLRLLLDLVGPGTTLLDLGAHLGTVSMCAARCGARVVAVEAAPRNVACLVESVRANALDVVVVPAAVATHRGRVHFLDSGPFGRIVDDGEGVEVEALTVSDILERAGADRPDVVKVDVEGHELAVVEGMRELLTRPDAPAVVIEGNGFVLAGAALTPADLLRRLEALGLQTWRIGDGELVRVGPDDLQPETVCDYLASRGRPPWPEREAPSTAEVVDRFVAESRHPLWTHRRYVAGVLATAPEVVVANLRIQDALERLLVDPDPAVHEAASWWARRPEANRFSALARSLRALAAQIRPQVSSR
jgi:FkbM family methyltransferase